jgi:putative tryptophan/tyrosine transport system substrate-binding protein
VKRREFIAGLGAAVWPVAAWAQQPERRRLDILDTTNNAQRALREALAELGWVEGRNLQIEYRSADSNDPALLRPHAEAIVRAAPDVIFTNAATAVQVLQRLTSTIPIVFAQSGDPIQGGSVQSLARPGGNVTGFLTFAPSINTKYLQLLRDVAPQVTHVSVLQTQASSWRGDFAVIEAVAPFFAVAAVATLVHDDAADIERSIVGFARDPNGGLILPPDGVTLKHHALIVALAAKYRLPAVYWSPTFVEAGGLMGYYGLFGDIYRRAASYVDRILKGENPADLPVQQSVKFELAINMRTAKTLGLTIPPNLLAIADEVIE